MTDKKTCPVCLKKFGPLASFCHQCGEKLPEASKDEGDKITSWDEIKEFEELCGEEGHKKQISFNIQLRLGLNFCPVCGKKLPVFGFG